MEKEEIVLVLKVIGTIFGLVTFITGIVVPFAWWSSCKEAQADSQITGKTFTCSEIFWAGDSIQINNIQK